MLPSICPRDISKSDAARITKLDTDMCPGKPFILRSVVKVTQHKKRVGVQKECDIDFCFWVFLSSLLHG